MAHFFTGMFISYFATTHLLRQVGQIVSELLRIKFSFS